MTAMKGLRSLAERLSRGVVLKRRLPASFGGGTIYVTPEARLAYWRFDLERADPALLQLASEFVQPGDVVWDIGANVGLFAVAAAHFAGPSGAVYAFEPDTWLAGLIRRTAAEQPPDSASIHTIPVALSDRVGLAELHIARRRAANSLEGEASRETGGFRATQVVPVFRADTLLDEVRPPRVVKVDVECVEHRVFKGAERMLREIKPVIISEMTDRNADWVSDWLAGFGYSFYDASAPQAARCRLERVTYNTLALPASMAGQERRSV